jgi:hypothetical protein
MGLLRPVIFQDGIAYGDAFVANVGPRVVAGTRDEFADDLLAFVTKRTAEGIVCTIALHARGSGNTCLVIHRLRGKPSKV